MTLPTRFLITAALPLLLLAAAAPLRAQAPTAPADPPSNEAPKEFSKAERLLFMGDQLGSLKRPASLRYQFRKTGSLEPGFDDSVVLQVKNDTRGQCCRAEVAFLTGDRRFVLPEVELPRANPVTLHFLERDVREMQRLTKGRSGYYQKRIRMAVFEGATVADVTLRYRGRNVPGQRIEISPYADDPAKVRFEKFSRKTYQFDLSDAVPGGVHTLRSLMKSAEDGAPALLVEELRLEGAEAPAAS